jgi:hypothetical protein
LVVALIAVPLLATSAASSSQSTLGPAFRFDLAAGSVEGHRLLGQKVGAVVAALGKPSARVLHRRYGSIRYGKSYPADLSVMFRRRAGALRAFSVAITSPAAREARLGRILRLSPPQLEREIADGYADTFRLVKPYRCLLRPARCNGRFESVDGSTNVSFGLLVPRPGSQLYVVIYT